MHHGIQYTWVFGKMSMTGRPFLWKKNSWKSTWTIRQRNLGGPPGGSLNRWGNYHWSFSWPLHIALWDPVSTEAARDSWARNEISFSLWRRDSKHRLSGMSWTHENKFKKIEKCWVNVKFARKDNFQKIFPTNNNLGEGRILGTIRARPTIYFTSKNTGTGLQIHCTNLIRACKRKVLHVQSSSFVCHCFFALFFFKSLDWISFRRINIVMMAEPFLPFIL